MKTTKKYILGAAAIAALSGGLSACQDHFDDYVPTAPVATLDANMTILELKEKYWENDEDNYIYKIGYTIENGDTIDDGQSYVIKGRVISSDQAGNVYKNLYIQDETAALPIGINSYNLYLKYRVGQEIVIDLKGMYCGKYSGLFQLGFPSYRDSYAAWAPSFMAPEFFQTHIELNGYPDTLKIDTLEINEFSTIGTTTPAILQKYQGQLVKFNNVYFQGAGELQFGEYHVSGTDRTIVDTEGNTITIRTSGYSDFWNQYLPEGNGDVIGILSYYGTSGWQVYLNSINDCVNFGNPTVAPGTEDNPYTVMDAIGVIESGKSKSGWVLGYIVGAVAPEVTQITSNDDIEWGADVTLANTLVIGATADTKDISEALVIALPQGSALRQYGNLVDNPTNYQKEIWVKGTLGTYMETYGVLDNNGTADEFKIEGVTIDNPNQTDIPDGTGTEDSPYNVAQVIALGNPGTTNWVAGYIVGTMNNSDSTNLENTDFSANNASVTNLVLGPTADCTDYTKCVAVQLPTGDVRSALNLKDNPGNLGAKVELYGSLEKYCGGVGIKSVSAYKFLSSGGNTGGGTTTGTGTGTESDPYTVAKVIELNNPGTEAWVMGYIVGTMNNSNSTNLENTDFSANDAVVTNLVLGPTADCTDYTKCIAVQLPSGDVRSALNLKDNPENLGAKVELYGSLEKYCGGIGVKSVSQYKILEAGSGGGNTGGGTTTGDGSGTESDPYSVAKVIELNNPGTEAWVLGYIVGTMNNSNSTNLENTEFSANDAVATNLVLGPTADCTDYTKCVAVQLPSGAVRNALNLKDNPENLGAKVKLYGSLEKYCGGIGIKSVSQYEFLEGGTGGNTGGGDSNNTVDNPYTVAEAIAIIAAGSYTSDKVYIAGTISQISEVSPSYGNATYYISDDGSTSNQLEVFRGYYLNGDKFTSEDQIKVGDKLVIYGQLTNYNGTYEVTTGSSIISIN
ncbi:MAG: DUF6359 domain-containing protein [Bacteroidales bacterium]|nr:DUF6359 domain-containing protein [Bacteroidales bacterium]